MPDPATRDRLRSLILSAVDLQGMTDWPPALIEDYLNILGNLVTIADLLDIEIDQKLEEVPTDFLDGSVPFVASGFLAENNPDLNWDMLSEVLRALNLSTNSLQFDLSPTGTVGEGRIQWNRDQGTYDAGLPGGVVGQMFEEDFIPVQNDTGSEILDGKVATYAGGIGNSGNIKAELTVASAAENPIMTLGLFTQNVADGAKGKVTTRGKVRGIQTDGDNYGEVWADDEILYKSSTIAGGLTNVAPNAPIPAIPLCVVISAHATNGTLEVRPTFPQAMTMLTDVNGTALTTTGQLPAWDQVNEYFDFTYNILDYQLKDDFTEGSVLFRGTTEIDEDNANFFWDNVNKRQGLGTTLPLDRLDVRGSIMGGVTAAIDGGYYTKLSLTHTTNPTRDGVTFSFQNSGQAFFMQVASVLGTDDQFFQGVTRSNSAYFVMEAYTSAGLSLQTYGAGGIGVNKPIIFSPERVEAMRIDGFGLIGVNKSVPVAQLDIVNRVSSNIVLAIKGAAAQSGDYVNITDSSGVGALILNAAKNLSVNSDTPPTSPNTYPIQSTQLAGKTFLFTENKDAIGDSFAGFYGKASTARIIGFAHGDGRSTTRYGSALAGWGEILASAGNGLAIGVGTLVAPIIFGSNNLERMRINSDGNIWVPADNQKTIWGAGQDASAYYDATNFVINPKEVGSGILDVLGAVGIQEVAADPTSPIEGKAVFWKSDGTGTGDDGDLLYREQSGGVTTTGSLKYKDMVPSSITLTTGTLVAGTVADVQTMFDGNVYHVDEVTGTPGFDIEFNFTGVDRVPTLVICRWIYDGSSTHYCTWDIWNYTTSAWDTLRMFKTSEAYYASMTMYLPRASNGDYVSGGNSMVRVYHQTAGNASHDIQIDYVGLTHNMQGVI